MNEKAVIILGAGLMQKPAICAAKELGFKTVVADGNPDAVCSKLADIFEPVDLKDKDGLVHLAEKIKEKGMVIAGVFTAGTDFSANTAYVAGHLGLFGHRYESCLNASNKVRMRECFKKNGVPSPEFEEVDENRLEELLILAKNNKISFPKVIKPVDNMGGRGCRLVRSEKELRPAVSCAINNSRTKKAIFEDYMEGAEFSIDALIYNGTFTVTGFADRHIYYPPYFIETGHTMPSVADSKIKNELIATFALGAKALGLTQGVAKADIKYTKNGPMIGEIAARLSGGYMSGWTFPLSSGCFLTKEALKISVGIEPDYILENRKKIEWKPHPSVKNSVQPFELYELESKNVSAERAWLSIPGKIAEIRGLKEASEVCEVEEVLPRAKKGDEVDFPRNNVEKCGNIITKASDRKSAEKAAYDALNKITLILETNNKKTEDFLEKIELADEKGFPPSAFDVELDWSKICNIPANAKIADFVPAEIKKVQNQICDWNHSTFAQVVEKFDSIFPDHKELDGKKFWKSALRGSIQGMLYTAKKQ